MKSDPYNPYQYINQLTLKEYLEKYSKVFTEKVTASGFIYVYTNAGQPEEFRDIFHLIDYKVWSVNGAFVTIYPIEKKQ